MTPTEYLLALVTSQDRKDKGDLGMRSTREVAEACGLKIATARRLLWAASERGLVDAYDGGASGAMGNEIFWRSRTS